MIYLWILLAVAVVYLVIGLLIGLALTAVTTHMGEPIDWLQVLRGALLWPRWLRK